MKKFSRTPIIFALIATFRLGLYGQPLFSLNPAYFYVTPTLPDTLLEIESISSYSAFEENTMDIIYLKWQVVVPADCPSAWKFLVGDTQLHWSSSVTSNIDPSINLYEPMPLNPAFDNYFQFDVRPFQVSGCCQVQVLFSLVDEPDSILEVITYDISMLDSSCFVSNSTIEEDIDSHTFYPNPNRGKLMVENFEELKFISFVTSSSVEILQIDNPTKEIDLSTLPHGIYYIRLLSKKGTISWDKVVLIHD